MAKTPQKPASGRKPPAAKPKTPAKAPKTAAPARRKATAKPDKTAAPAEARKVPAGSIWRASTSAIGERMAFMPHRNRIERGGAAPVANRAYPFQCSTQTSVNRRRAVSKSTSILPASRSISVCEPSLCSPRRPMSMASICDGVEERIAS